MAKVDYSIRVSLSMALAIYVKDCSMKWEPYRKVKVLSTYPKAMAATAIHAFAKYMEEMIGTNYHAASTKIDIVAHMWEVSMTN